MLSTRVIPCLDVHAGRVVKGVQFESLIDAGDPVEIAKAYQEQGADELVFLDITASSDERDTILQVVEKTASVCFMPLTVGGGLRSVENIRTMLNAGADKVSLNTAALIDPQLIFNSAKKFGNQCIVVAIDAKQVAPQKWEVFTHGGRKPTGLDAIAWAKQAVSLGAGEILLTSMDKDGTKDGYDLPLTAAIVEAVEVPVIASGGAGELQHLVEVVQEAKASAVLAASIFHFGTYSIAEAKRTLQAAGIPARI